MPTSRLVRLLPALALLAHLALAVGCGGGGGDGGGDDENQPTDPLAGLEGTWGGPGFDSLFLQITFDAAGSVTQITAGSEVLPGPHAVETLTDDVFQVLIGTTGGSFETRMVLSPSGDYATLVAASDIFALQRGATAPRTAPFTLGDLGPATWTGRGVRFTAGGTLLEDTSSTVDFAADGSYAGSDGLGLSYSSVGADPTLVDPNDSSGRSTYQDNDPLSDAVEVFLLVSPDGGFLAALAAPSPLSDAITQSRFVAAWEKE